MLSNKRFFLAFILIVVGVASRFIFLVDGTSILPNFSAVGAVALFGATYLKGANKWLVPLALLWISDMILNNVVYAEYFESYQFLGDYWVYGAFILTGTVGYYILKRKASWVRLAVSGVMAGVVFYVITNFGVWATTSMYPRDMSGLMACYIAAIPFFINTILGNLFYGFVLFGIYELVANRTKELTPVLGTVIV